ncbi:restriction endonuclease subunit S [Ornithinicoccus halotolerans]|uniref:restriction endonuclease subunit S n=1 Tax=Ornithinicoccus halotolerans TaxID=1748220 RepID=UPI001297F728|nr:restriction endonuclease subunit S [Ornithinicoccus halotolerans]
MREGWRTVSVGDVAQVMGGGTPKSSVAEYWGGEVQWLTPKDLSQRPARYTSSGERTITEEGLKNSGARLLPPGAVLLTSRAPVGYVSVASGPIATNQGFKSLVLNDDQLPEFWYYLLGHSTEYLRANSGGSTFQEISGGALKALRFTVPPLDEQRRIVDLIGAVYDAMEAAEALSDSQVPGAALPTLDAQLLTALLPSSAREGWAEVTLGDIARVDRTSVSPSNMPAEVRLYSIPGLDAGRIPEDVRAADIGSNKFLIKEPALLISMLNPRIPRHVVAEAGAVCSTEFAVLVPDEAHVLLGYLRLIARTEQFQQYLTSRAKGTTGSRSRSKASDVLSYQCPLPPLAEQRHIVEVMDTVDDARDRCQRHTLQLRELRSALLAALLSGEHEIPESYDELLEGVA